MLNLLHRLGESLSRFTKRTTLKKKRQQNAAFTKYSTLFRKLNSSQLEAALNTPSTISSFPLTEQEKQWLKKACYQRKYGARQ